METNSWTWPLFMLFFCFITIEKHSFSEMIMCWYLCQNNIFVLWLHLLVAQIGGKFVVSSYCIYLEALKIRILETAFRSKLGVLCGCD